MEEQLKKMDINSASASGGDLWENPDRFVHLMNADGKQVRRNALSSALSHVKALPSYFLKTQRPRRPSEGMDSDDDVESEEEESGITADAGGDNSRTQQQSSDRNEALPSLKQVEAIVKPIMKGLFDPAEKCRELSYEILIALFERLPKSRVVQFLPHTVPILLERLGQQELIESSEEVRLIALGFMKLIVKKIGKDLSPFVDDWIRILSVTLVDPFHEVRKTTCVVTSLSARAMPDVFHYNSERLNKPLCISITHQQAKVRENIVFCIGDVVFYGNHKGVEDFIPHLTQRLFDPQACVRKAVIDVIAVWLADFVDRYSYFHKFIPIIITGMCDETPLVSELAYKYWEKVGEKYLEENLEEYKDQVDFPSEMPEHYPDDVKRPNFGCRLLTQRNVCKIIPGVTNDITDWTETTRQKCAQLLFHLILNCEDKITMHVEPILQCMFKTCLDPYPVVSKFVLQSARLIGYFVPLSITLPILTASLTASLNEGPLAVTASILDGTDPKILSEHALEISNFISSPDLCRTLKTGRQYWILRCCDALIKVISETVGQNTVEPVFRMLISVFSMAQDAETQGKAMIGLEKLREAAGFSNVDEVFVRYGATVLEEIKTSNVLWLSATPEKLVFATILTQGGSAVDTHMNLILDILVSQLNPKRDAEVRLKLFTLLSEILTQYSESIRSQAETQSKKLQIFVKAIVEDVLTPNLVWRAGKAASALRAAASSCLLVILEQELLEAELFSDISPKVVNSCIGLMDDAYYVNRLLGTQCLGRLPLCCEKQLSTELTHKAYPELLKRLDDEKNEVRKSAAIAIARLFGNLPENYDVELYKCHLDYLMNVLIVHLDDEKVDMQETVSETLKTVGSLSPNLLLEKCTNYRILHRSPLNCDNLIAHFKSNDNS